MPTDDLVIRPPQPGDGAGIAECQIEATAHLADLEPRLFRTISAEGRAERLERVAVTTPDKEAFWRVAAVDRRIAGYVFATFRPADPAAQGVRYPAQPRIWVESLIVQQPFARRGNASRLMAVAEDWARDRGAELVMLQTWADSPESVPFYENIGYRRRAIIFQKEL